MIAFLAGVFRLEDLASGRRHDPSDLPVRGVGMDATLLYVATQRARDATQRLCVEDCTVFCDPLLDLRSAPRPEHVVPG